MWVISFISCLFFILANTLTIFSTQGLQFLLLIKIFLFILPEILFCQTSVMLLARRKHKFMALFLATLVMLVYAVQSISIYFTGDLIGTVALENINMIDHILINSVMIKVGTILFIILGGAAAFLYQAIRKISTLNYRVSLYKILFFFLTLLVLYLENTVFLQSDFFLFNRTPIVSLLSNGCKALGFDIRKARLIDSASPYPFLKQHVYKSDLPFQANKLPRPLKPNIIVFFMEGTSARTFTDFSKLYPDLTPHINNFRHESMEVDDYYNHTSATFRGLHGQLCSMWPYKGGWMGNKKGWGYEASHLKQGSYSSIPVILQSQGYTSVFFSPHSQSDPMTALLQMLKFNDIYYAEKSIQALGITKKTALHGNFLRDKYNVRSLIYYLKKHEAALLPFFIGLYNIETHTGVDVINDDSRYGDGKNESLNTIHNFDTCFGEFWKYFKDSPYAQNTIVIITADHCHYPDTSFRKLAEKDPNYQALFIDKIPLYIHIPWLSLPEKYAHGITTSAQFASSLCHLIGIKDVQNNFMAPSVFEQHAPQEYGIHYAGEFFLITREKIFHESRIPLQWKKDYNKKVSYIDFFHKCESQGRVFPTNNLTIDK